MRVRLVQESRVRSRSEPPLRAGGIGMRGFNLVEAMVVIVIFMIAIVASAGPALDALRTYRRNAAAQDVMAAMRFTQSLAVERNDVFVLQWGGHSSIGRPASEYRIVRDLGSCTLPGDTDPEDGVDVILGWTDLTVDHPTLTISTFEDSTTTSIPHAMFDYMGGAVDTCATRSYPLSLTLADDAGRTRAIEVRASGTVRIP